MGWYNLRLPGAMQKDRCGIKSASFLPETLFISGLFPSYPSIRGASIFAPLECDEELNSTVINGTSRVSPLAAVPKDNSFSLLSYGISYRFKE